MYGFQDLVYKMGAIGKAYFKYKSTNYAILNSYTNNFIYNYLDLNNSVTWSNLNEISFDEESNNLLGNWYPYSDISTINTDAYKLNHSQYGPIIGY